MLKSKIYSLLFFMLFLSAQQLCAQVRIGGGLPAAKGALLDVNSSAELSNRGLLLPRVTLTDLFTLADIDPDNEKRPDAMEHIGLTVYGLVDENSCIATTSGVFIWAGTEWIKVGSEEVVSELQQAINNKNNLNLIYDVDQEGDVIVAQDFGSGGVWMLHNLAVSTFADGTPIAAYKGTNDTFPQYAFPNTNKWENATGTYSAQQGYLYNWYAATQNSKAISDQQQSSILLHNPGQQEVESRNGHIQGICPNGWHLPSDREWTELSKELFMHPSAYSRIGDDEMGKNWDTKWEENFEAGEMGCVIKKSNAVHGVGTVYKDPCKIVRSDASLPTTKGLSSKLRVGGLNIQMTGFVTNSMNVNFGYAAYLWSSSANNNHAYFRSFSTEINGINKSTADKNNLFLVRCKRD